MAFSNTEIRQYAAILTCWPCYEEPKEEEEDSWESRFFTSRCKFPSLLLRRITVLPFFVILFATTFYISSNGLVNWEKRMMSKRNTVMKDGVLYFAFNEASPQKIANRILRPKPVVELDGVPYVPLICPFLPDSFAVIT